MDFTRGALRIALADDTEDIRLPRRLSLTTADGFDIVGEAADGRAAVELVAATNPDVILLDLSMPVMDGLQAIPEILDVSPDTKIVVLSGFDDDRMKPFALELGADLYLEKGEAAAGSWCGNAGVHGEEVGDLSPHVVRAAFLDGQVLAAVTALDDHELLGS